MGESPDTASQFWESAGVRRASRIYTALIASCFGVASWYAVQAVREAYLAGGSILHPSHAILRPIGMAVGCLVSTVYFAWIVVTNPCRD